jgi:hypothetical protein
MRKNLLLALIFGLAILIVTTVSATAQGRLTEQSKVAINGIGSIKVGMTVAEASLLINTPLVPNNYTGAEGVTI